MAALTLNASLRFMIFNHALLSAGSLGMEWNVGKMLLAFFLKFEAVQDLMAHFMIEFRYLFPSHKIVTRP